MIFIQKKEPLKNGYNFIKEKKGLMVFALYTLINNIFGQKQIFQDSMKKQKNIK